MPLRDENNELEDLDWNLIDRNRRLASGELLEECADPTEVLIGEDD